MTRQNGSIIGKQIKGSNQPGMWTPDDAQQRALRGDWGTGLGTIRYLVVGGGGGGGGARPSNINAGGGGGGGVLTGTEILYEGRKYDITVGGPGNSGSAYTPGGRGGSSSFLTNTADAPPQYPGTSFKHLAYGGGGGGAYSGFSPSNAKHGGSGGGASSNGQTTAGGGLNPTIGPSPNTIPSPIVPTEFPDYVPGTTQGYNGGATAAPPNVNGGGGGGGAGGVGGNASSSTGGAGGAGFASDITGSTAYYGGGGGGGGPSGGGAGGSGGGGAGAGPVPPTAAVAGSAGTSYGGGGGGAATRPGNPAPGTNGGIGFPGCVILRFPNAFELDLSSAPQAPTSVDAPYPFTVLDEGDIGSDHYITFGSPINDIKFKRK